MTKYCVTADQSREMQGEMHRPSGQSDTPKTLLIAQPVAQAIGIEFRFTEQVEIGGAAMAELEGEAGTAGKVEVGKQGAAHQIACGP